MPARPIPAPARADHTVAFSAPFYAAGDRRDNGGLCLHRYLDAEFIPRFLSDLRSGRLADPTTESWWQTDRFSQHGRELVLRLPVHRAFYLVACELVCDRPTRPALDPARIRSAGFVIRTRTGNGRWLIESGEPLGWQTAAAPTDSGADAELAPDPDPRRRIAARRSAAGRSVAGTSTAAGGAYTGEETHPLHPVLVVDADGKPHTILYGFLPLGGQSLSRGNPFTAADEAVAVAADRDLLTWPFGHRGRADLTWRAGDATLVDDGRPNGACFELLELLVNRYHVAESAAGSADPFNDDLAAAAARLQFVEQIPGPSGGASQRTPRFTLLAYLTDCFAAGPDNPLAAWLAAQRTAIDAAGGPPGTAPSGRLPRRPVDTAGELVNYTLSITRAEAEEWRLLLGQRLLDQVRRTGAELPLPKFRQESDALYQVIPFVRALDDAGCERLTWAGPAVRSTAFRVAAPFDPDASRPTLIQMPGLADLKRGLAKGAAMLVPPDTARMLAALNIDKGAAPGVATAPPPPGAGLGVQMICSFSLPIITLVAMILLMIMVTILNLLFFWLPWVKICLPFPKLK